MNKISMVYFSNTENSKALSDAFNEEVESKGGDIYYSEVGEADKDEFLKGDILVFVGPASGTEEVEDTEMMPFIEEISDDLSGRKVFMMGSYGWGGGEFMETWKEIMTDKGAEIVREPIICLETPEDDVLEEVKEAADELLG